jgi:hypothetical protein
MSSEGNMFNNLLEAVPPSLDNHSELNCYLAMDVKDVKDGIMWWHERCTTFPHLSCMAWDYLLIPGKCHIFVEL